MISFTAGASRFARDLVYAAIPTSTSLQPFAGFTRIAGAASPDDVHKLPLCDLVACSKAYARGPGTCGRTRRGERRHLSLLLAFVSLARSGPCQALLWLPTLTP